MTRVVILKATDPEAEGAAEMEYLLSMTRLEAERAFGEARVGGEAGEDDLVLLLGATDVMIREPSLRRMGQALRTGAEAVVPTRVAEVGLPPGSGAYTLSDFERAEGWFLEGGAGQPDTPVHLPEELLPVSLVTAHTLRRLGGDPEDVLEGRSDPTVARGLYAARRGLYHEFIDYYGEVRSDVLPFLPEDCREVLEVGCGRGATGEMLQRELDCRVTGVEMNAAVARDAEGRLHRVVVGNVEAADTLTALEPPYDALLALELFEHLVEPERFLQRVRPLVRPGGRIVLSVPNVGHHSVVRDLLAGRWDYLPIGILCYTHYRFYTRHTLADWLARCGFPDARLVPQHTEPPAWLPPEGAAGTLPGTDLPVDAESLRTKGFYVLLDV